MKWLLGIIVIVIVVVAGWYLLSGNPDSSAPTGQNATTTTTFDIISGVPNEVYTDPQLSFSIEYPATAIATSSFSAGYLPLTQTPRIGFELPQSMFSGTNLVDAGVYIGATTTPEAMAACTDLSDITSSAATSAWPMSRSRTGAPLR